MHDNNIASADNWPSLTPERLAELEQLGNIALAKGREQYSEAIKATATAPLPEIESKKHYPIGALGPILSPAAKIIASITQSAIETAAQSVLAVASYAAQDKYNVKIGTRSIPLSLFLLTICESGERKSTADKLAASPIERWERDQIEAHKAQLKEFNDDTAIYDLEYKNALKSGGDLSVLHEPIKPPQANATMQEPTLEGIQKSYIRGIPSQALLTDEGAQFFGGHAMNKDNLLKTIAGLSKFWDASPMVRTRAGDGESATLYNRRLTTHIMLQPAIFDKVASDPVLMAQGFLARFLVARPAKKAGSRPYFEPEVIPADVNRFHNRIAELLSAQAIAEDGGCDLKDMQMSPEAKEVYVEYYNTTESMQADGEKLDQINPVASKSAEMAIRVAGVFAVIEGSGQISEQQMIRGAEIAQFNLLGLLRDNQVAEINVFERKASDLLDWLNVQEGRRSTADNIGKKSPRSVRPKSVRDTRAIMDRLVKSGDAECLALNTRGDATEWRAL